MVSVDSFIEHAIQRGATMHDRESGAIIATMSTSELVLRQVVDSELVVLGLDGFTIESNEVAPQLDLIADFSSIRGSWKDRVSLSAAEARSALVDWGSRADLIEFVLDGLED